MRISTFIAGRLFSKDSGASRSTAVHIATAGVCLGVLIMLLSVSVAFGFKKEISSKVAGFCGAIEVVNYEMIFNPMSRPVSFSKERMDSLYSLPHVKHLQRFAKMMGMMKTEDTFLGVQFRGVGEEYDLNFLRTSLVDGEMLPLDVKENGENRIFISRYIASKLKLKVGSRIFAYFFDQSLKARRFTVAAIYETHLAEFDEKLCFVDLSMIQTLSRWEKDQVSGVELLVDDFENIDETAKIARHAVNKDFDKYGEGYAAFSVKELYPQIFSWLDLLDTNVLAILILMLCVCSVTAVCGLLVIILEHTNLIGTMKAIGATNAQVRHTFLHLALYILVRAIVLGNILTLLCIFIQNKTGIISLNPETYYVSQVPMSVTLMPFLWVNVGTILICLLSLLMPSMVISRIKPATSMRFE